MTLIKAILSHMLAAGSRSLPLQLPPLDLLAPPVAANTSRAYTADWRHFTAWCAAQKLNPLPADPTTLIRYAASQAEAVKSTTIERRLAAIAWRHQLHGFESPTHRTSVRRALRNLRRQTGSPAQGKDPLLPADLERILAQLPSTLAGHRDRALLLTGFLGGFRRSELAALDVKDAEFVPEGVVISLRRSKTDQEGRGRKVALPAAGLGKNCPVHALRRWMAEARLATDALFRRVDRHGHLLPARLTGQAVNLILKRHAAAAGLDATRFGAHSLRTGLVTAAARAGKPERIIMAQTGHRSISTVRRYIQEALLFQENAADGLLG